MADDLDPSEIEMDQRSQGLQYFFSFYLVFLVEAEGAHANSILLLDKPGLHVDAAAHNPVRELDYLKRTSHYGSVHALEILLRRTGWLRDAGSTSHGERVRRDDSHTAMDRIIVESRQAKRHGDREDLGRYDERFASLYLSWTPTLLAQEEGSRPLHGLPHVIRIERRCSPGAIQPSGCVSPALMQLAPQFGEPVWMSGQ